MSSTSPSPGRPAATTHDAIADAAFALFAERGFTNVTLDDIARAVGVGRRTLFRYYASKNDIPWGRFDESLVDFRASLAETPRGMPLAEAIRDAVVQFNFLDPHAVEQHRLRMGLILTTPELQAHSVHRYAAWRRVVAEFVAERLGGAPGDLLPQSFAQVSLALAVTAYEHWLVDHDAELEDLIVEAFGAMAHWH